MRAHTRIRRLQGAAPALRALARPAAAGLVAALLLGSPMPASAHHGRTSFEIGIHYGAPVAYDPWVRDFALFYGCPLVMVDDYSAAGFPEEDMAVAIYLAHYSGFGVNVIVDWRREGLGWYEISRRCDVSPAVFFTPLASPREAYGIYSRPYAHWGGRAESDRDDHWRMSDREARELVGLRFATERYHRDPRWVMRERTSGRDWNQVIRTDPREGRQGREGQVTRSRGSEVKWKKDR